MSSDVPHEVDALAADGTLSIDGFVYVDGTATDAHALPHDKRSGDSTRHAATPVTHSNGDDDDDDNEEEDPAVVAERHREQLLLALQSLKLYNPDFNLTPDVLEIMRMFFDDLHPDADGTIALRSLFDEIERLDPSQELVSPTMRDRMWRDMVGTGDRVDERIDFHGFCAWVMHWKAISPSSVESMYVSWAQQIAMVDFGLHEADGVFVVRGDELPPSDVLKTELSRLLQLRQRPSRRANRQPTASSSPGSRNESTDTDSAGMDHATTSLPVERLARTLSRSLSSAAVDALTGHVSVRGAAANTADSNEPNEPNEPSPPTTTATQGSSMATVSKSFLAGGAAGIVAKSVLAPVDRVKIMFQVSDTRTFSFRNAVTLAKEIYVHDGFRALFRGNMLNILRVVPYAGVQHSSFDLFRRKFHAYNFQQAETRGRAEQLQQLSNFQLVTAGSLAGGLSLIVAYPLDIVRARYMVQQGKSQYQTIAQAIAAMYKTDGARSFSRGLVPSLLGTLPYTGIGFALNEKFKTLMLELKVARLDNEARMNELHPPRLHPFSKFLCSYLAACIAQTTTYPMDTIRRRIQTDGFVPGAPPGTLRYTGVATTARIIVAQEGWRGFFKGVSVNWMRSPLATGISLTTYDILKDVMGVEKVV